MPGVSLKLFGGLEFCGIFLLLFWLVWWGSTLWVRAQIYQVLFWSFYVIMLKMPVKTKATKGRRAARVEPEQPIPTQACEFAEVERFGTPAACAHFEDNTSHRALLMEKGFVFPEYSKSTFPDFVYQVMEDHH